MCPNEVVDRDLISTVIIAGDEKRGATQPGLMVIQSMEFTLMLVEKIA